MWGFEARTVPATGTLDPLYARVLVLEAQGKRLAIVTPGAAAAMEPPVRVPGSK